MFACVLMCVTNMLIMTVYLSRNSREMTVEQESVKPYETI